MKLLIIIEFILLSNLYYYLSIFIFTFLILFLLERVWNRHVNIMTKDTNIKKLS